ncbi:MAG TPA: hypothetical protein QGF02_00545 [Candidatus Babeliales bacterium]|nr:hypothetical protein [Candidatus Babeliales bacterium]
MIKKILLTLCLIFTTGHAVEIETDKVLAYRHLCESIAQIRENLSDLDFNKTCNNEDPDLLSELANKSKWYKQKLNELLKYLPVYEDIHSLEEEYEQLRIEYANHKRDEQTLEQKIEATTAECEAYNKKTTLTACERYDREAIEEKKLKKMNESHKKAKNECDSLLTQINEYNNHRKKLISQRVPTNVLKKPNLKGS